MWLVLHSVDSYFCFLQQSQKVKVLIQRKNVLMVSNLEQIKPKLSACSIKTSEKTCSVLRRTLPLRWDMFWWFKVRIRKEINRGRVLSRIFNCVCVRERAESAAVYWSGDAGFRLTVGSKPSWDSQPAQCEQQSSQKTTHTWKYSDISVKVLIPHWENTPLQLR